MQKVYVYCTCNVCNGVKLLCQKLRSSPSIGRNSSRNKEQFEVGAVQTWSNEPSACTRSICAA